MKNTDLISEIFSTLRIKSELYFRTRMSGNYAVRVPREKRRIRFHVVLSGECWITDEAGRSVLMQEGDIVLVPNGASQVLSSTPEEPCAELSEVIADGNLKDGTLYVGSGPEKSALLCGFCRFDEDLDHPMLTNLPSIIVLRVSDLGKEPWVAAALKLFSLEAKLNTQGTSAIVERLIEIIVIQATRRLERLDEVEGNCFTAALTDPALSKSLQVIHTQPEKSWRVDELAVLAGMSRAGFADKFSKVVGIPPIEYLTNWRLMRARTLLSDTGLGTEEIAERCGYKSLPSFSRRFKKQFGISPGAFRRLKLSRPEID
ncbi:AraC family transcriptional regulator [Maridesulfovibrio sp.]|uniref:AraC family transcriptional regulator n=1 Tax=Maridesulfovibrio sp. TaxID=2795000 RepID=UPI002A18AAA3|nr:AraC family transcriptional regulator [Maridesulfovibrio sp.]